MAFTLPALPYPAEALEPYIDAKTMEIHHGKHHQAYVTNVNKALESAPELASKTVDELLANNLAIVPDAIKTAVRNNGGGHANHSLFWTQLAPNAGGAPKGDIASVISANFGSFDAFKEKFAAAATGRFGSGWAWLTKDSAGKFEISSLGESGQPNHGSQEAGSWLGRLGTRLLPEIPEPPPRVHRGLVECD